MRKLIIVLIFLFFSTLSILANEVKSIMDNPWLKTYSNFKNYNTIISNITKIEDKLKNTKIDSNTRENLLKKLSINKSKLGIYEKNYSFDSLLIKYKFSLDDITLREYIFKNKLNELNKLIKKFQKDKNLYYSALATLENEYSKIDKKDIKSSKTNQIKNDIDYFKEFSENIEKTEQNLYELENELNKKYIEYKEENLYKHITTIFIIFIVYFIYKIISKAIISYINSEDKDLDKNYDKLLSVIFVISVFIFILIRYIDDLLYIITFLSVVAAALTIAMREVILNIAGAIYIFLTSVVKVGDRVMVQFETKHTIGDIVNISLIKIKLQEVDDYTNIKEIKSVGRTIYIPNSYIFTKVFYNYSIKKNKSVNDLIEFEFDINNDFDFIEKTISDILIAQNISFKIYFALNSTKTAILCTISYEVNFKEIPKTRGKISILLFSEFNKNENIKLKTSKTISKQKDDDE